MRERIGPYRVTRRLGAGGMGQVFAGRRAPGEAEVALKVLHAQDLLDSGGLARFQAEVEAMRSLRHPHVVRILDWGRDGPLPWLAMELIEGESLDRLLERGRLSPLEAVELAEPVADALAQAHERGILHRDLKPANVILRARDGQPLLTDFGLARRLDRSQGLTQTGEIVGSPGFLAPEQCGSGQEPGPTVDVYGLGALLYALVTGRPPCPGATVLDSLRAVLESPPLPPSDLVPGFDPALEELILRCLAKDALERPPSVRSVQRELRAWREGLSAGAARTGLPRGAVGALAALAAFTLGGIGAQLAGQGEVALASPAPAPAGSPAQELPGPAPSAAPEASPPTRLARPPSGVRLRSAGSQGPAFASGGDPLPLDSPRLQRISRETGALIAEGQLVRALQRLTEECAREPAPLLHFMRGNLLGRLGRWEEAERAFSDALALEPSVELASQLYANRGCARGKLAKVEAEQRDYRRSIELQPAQALVYIYRGWTHYVSQRSAEALADYGRALEHRPTARLYANRGMIYAELRQLSQARDDLERALELEPGLALAKKLEQTLAGVERLDWATKRMATKDLGPEVERTLRELCAAGLDEAGYRLAVLLSLSGRRSEGERYLEEAAEQGHRTAAYELYRERLRQRRYHDARLLLRRAIELGSFAAMLRQGRLHLERARAGAPRAEENRVHALRYFRLVQSRGQPDGLAWIGKVHELAGERALAERCYREAVERGSGRACTHLAQLLEGQDEEQDRLFSLARQRGDGRALAISAWGLVSRGAPGALEKGAKLLRSACFLGSVMAHLRLAELMMRSERQEEAIHLLEQVAEEGFLEGMVGLGALLSHDQLDPLLRDLAGGSGWLRRAAEWGQPQAAGVLLNLLPRLREAKEPEAAWAAGWVLQREGRLGEARPLLERAAAGGVQPAARLLREVYR